MKFFINTIIKGGRYMTILGLLTFLHACVDEDVIEQPTTALLAILDNENEVFEDESADISVSFVQPVTESGTVEVSFDGSAVYGVDFVTEPAGDANGTTISIPVGARELSLTINPINRSGSIEEARQVSMTFQASGGTSFGIRNEATVNIINRPEIEVTGMLDNFGEIAELETSESQSFKVSGLGLTSDLTFTAPQSYEISLDDSDFDTELTLGAADINDIDTTVYVRFSAQFNVLGAQSGDITLSSENASDISVAVVATTVEREPTITVDATDLNLGTTQIGEFSSSVEVTVFGFRLTEDISVSVMSPFQVSLDDMTFAASALLDFNTINGGDSIKFFVRFAPDSGVDGTKTGTVDLTSNGANPVAINLEGFEQGLPVIAFTSFEEPVGTDVGYTDLGDPNVEHELINNAGESPVMYTSTGGELGFRSFYIPNDPPGVGLTDGDDLGVTTKTSIVLSYTDGVQGYGADDVDGTLRIVFDPVDATGLTTMEFKMDYLMNSTAWEGDDFVRITLTNSNTDIITLFDITGDDIEAQTLDDELWRTISSDISAFAGDSSVQLTIEFKSNSGAEEIYFENIIFSGI